MAAPRCPAAARSRPRAVYGSRRSQHLTERAMMCACERRGAQQGHSTLPAPRRRAGSASGARGSAAPWGLLAALRRGACLDRCSRCALSLPAGRPGTSCGQQQQQQRGGWSTCAHLLPRIGRDCSWRTISHVNCLFNQCEKLSGRRPQIRLHEPRPEPATRKRRCRRSATR